MELIMDRKSIYANKTLNQSSKLLLLFLTEFNPSNPKYYELADGIAVSLPTLRVSLEQLEQMGFIQKGVHVIEGGFNETNI
jgi:DNA-binding MarR family transcriptional regulator